jgi:hypothetical protein
LSQSRLPNTRRPIPAQPASKFFSTVTIARIATLHGLPVGPFSLSTTPFRFTNRTSSRSASVGTGRISSSFRPWLGARRCALAFVALCSYSPPPLHFPACRPQTEASMEFPMRQASEFRLSVPTTRVRPRILADFRLVDREEVAQTVQVTLAVREVNQPTRDARVQTLHQGRNPSPETLRSPHI